MDSSMAQPSVNGGTAAPRLGRLGATVIDASIGTVFLFVAGIVAFGWLLAATGGGGREPTSIASSIAFAIVMAAIPGWLAYLATSAWSGAERGATPGQARRGIAVAGSPARRLVRLGAHPLGTSGWWWLAIVTWLATIPALPLVLLSAGVLTAAAGLFSALLVALHPQSPLLHDRVAGTRMVSQ